MVCFYAWILPHIGFQEAAKKIGEIFSIPLSENSTDRFDEYPACAIDFEDDENVFIRLLDTPPDLERLLVDWSCEFDEKDRNYALCICAHRDLPVFLKGGFTLPYSSSYELAHDVIKKLHKIGLKIYTKQLPYTIETRGADVEKIEYPV